MIATANNRDKGVNDLSSALRRRFNTVVLPLPDSIDQEVEIVTTVFAVSVSPWSCRRTWLHFPRSGGWSLSCANCGPE